MDLSFARRATRSNARNRQGPDLAILLARTAARQALSPTARREAVASQAGETDSCLSSKASLFVAGLARPHLARVADGSFNADAAQMLAAEGQQK